MTVSNQPDDSMIYVDGNGPPVTVLKIHRLNKNRVRRVSPYQVEESLFYVLEMSGPVVNSGELEVSPGIPVWGSLMPGNDRLFVVNYHADMITDAPQCYELEVVYSNYYPQDQMKLAKEYTPVENPLLRPAQIESQTYRTREIIDTDLDGIPVTTTAGEPIIHEEEKGRRVFFVQKNVQAVSAIFCNTGDFMNKDTVTIYGQKYAPETLWLTDINLSAQQLEYFVPYFSLTYKLYHREETWRVKKRNVGYYCLQQQGFNKVIRQTGKQGQFTTDTVPNMAYCPVKVGNPATFTKTPIPLRNTPDNIATHGTVFPEYLALDPMTGQTFKDADKVNLTPARLKAIFDEATLTFRTKYLIKFSGNVPLT